MLRTVTIVALLSSAICIPTSLAQLGPEAPMLPKTTLAPFGIDIPEAATTSAVSANPAGIVGLSAYGIERGTELDLGWTNFKQGPSVFSDIEIAIGQIGDGWWRFSRYGFNSTAAPLPLVLPEGATARFSGEAYLVGYGRQDGDLRWGVSYLPYDSTTLTVFTDSPQGQVRMAKGRGYAGFAGRTGGQWLINEQLTLGSYYMYERDRTSLETIDGQTLRGGYDSEALTTGLAWQPAMGTMLFASYQTGSIRGPNVDETIGLWCYGAEQFLSEHWSLRATNIDEAWGLTATYYNGPAFNAGISWQPDGFRRTAEYLGNGDSLWLWAGIGW